MIPLRFHAQFLDRASPAGLKATGCGIDLRQGSGRFLGAKYWAQWD
jgi:hypothetical protein